MVQLSILYRGELRCGAVHGPSGAAFDTDAPRDNMGRGESFSPTDLVAAALGSCMITTIGIAAKKGTLPVTLDGTRVEVEKHMSADSPRRIVRLPITIEIPLPSDHPDRKLLEATALGCPVHHSVHPDIDKPVTFVWSGN